MRIQGVARFYLKGICNFSSLVPQALFGTTPFQKITKRSLRLQILEHSGHIVQTVAWRPLSKGHSADYYPHFSDLQTFVSVYRFTLIEGHGQHHQKKRPKLLSGLDLWYVYLGSRYCIFSTSCSKQVVYYF